MSRSLQRIYFHGNYSTSPPTANNNNVAYVNDADNVALTAYYAAMDDATLVTTMSSVEPLSGGVGTPPAQLPGYWDYAGDGSLRFDAVDITGADVLEDGQTRRIVDDPLVGKPVTTRAVLVDLDPTGQINSQIFANFFKLGSDADGFCNGTSPSKASTRWLYIPRNLDAPDGPASACATFQSVVGPDNLDVEPGDSEILQLVRQVKEEGRGLKILFCLYFTTPPALDPWQQAAEYATGNYLSNPKPGFIVGTVSPWSPGEPKSYPPGRLIMPTRIFDPDAKPSPTAPLGPALAEIDYPRSVLTLNLITTIPETDKELEKVDLGELTLSVEADGVKHLVGTIPYERYNKEAYEASAGIVELPFAPDLAEPLRNGLLSLEAADTAPPCQMPFGDNPLLQEPRYTLITDEPTIYLDEGQSRQIRVRVTERGGPPTSPVEVHTGQWRAYMSDPGARSDPHLVQRPGVAPNQGYREEVLAVDAGSATTDPNGVATFTVSPVSAGNTSFYFWVDHQPPAAPSFFSMVRWYFGSVRVLPLDDALGENQNPTWDEVYEKVLRYYYILFPVMRFLPLNDEQAVDDNAESILARTSLDIFDSTGFMPVTRDMSAGRRRLLHTYLRNVLAKKKGSPAGTVAERRELASSRFERMR